MKTIIPHTTAVRTVFKLQSYTRIHLQIFNANDRPLHVPCESMLSITLLLLLLLKNYNISIIFSVVFLPAAMGQDQTEGNSEVFLHYIRENSNEV